MKIISALFATALVQALVTVIALIARLGYPASGPSEIVILNGFFIVLWVGSAWLFREAARAHNLLFYLHGKNKYRIDHGKLKAPR